MTGLRSTRPPWEDIWDGLVSESRRKETGIPYLEYRGNQSLRIPLRIWAKRKRPSDPIAIYMAVEGNKWFIKNVFDDPRRKARCHKALFRDLKRLLVEAGKWPFNEQSTR